MTEGQMEKPKNRSLSVVAYDRGAHEAALLRFTEKVMGAQARALRQPVLDSFHEGMPGCDRVPLRHIVLDGDRVAGMLGYMPADFLVKGEPMRVRFTHDLLVDPDYRGYGLAKQIVENARKLGDFFPGGMWMTIPCYKIHLASGFDDMAPLTTYTSVLDPDSFSARRGFSPLKRAASRVGLGVARSFALRKARARVERDGASLKDVEGFDAALDPAWLTLAKSYALTRVRDAAYLNWKYMDHPTLDYRALTATRGDRVAGFVVWRPAPAGAVETRAVIVDFLVEKEDATTLQLLVSRVLLDAAGLGIDSVALLTTQSWASDALRSFGFLPGRTRNTWVIAGWRDIIPPEWLRNLEPWHVCLGDSDGDIWTGTME